MFKRRHALALAALISIAACASVIETKVNPPAGPVPGHIQRAVNSAERPAASKARDSGRRPKDVLAFAGLRDGDRIIELASFGQYYSMIFAEAVGPRGHAYMYDLPALKPRSEGPSRAFVAGHPNTTYAISAFDRVDFPHRIDAIYIMLFYHDLKPNGIDTALMNKRLFSALKPGGRVIVEDHRATPGSGWRDAANLHRIDTAVILEEMKAAGFSLSIDSDILANPRDDRTKSALDPTVRGLTDRSLFVFQKPG